MAEYDEIKFTTKGQIVVPARLRKRLRIRPGTRATIHEVDGRLIIDPVPEDPVSKYHGMFRDNGQALRLRMREHRREDK